MATQVSDEFLTGIRTQGWESLGTCEFKLRAGIDMLILRNAAEVLALANWMVERAGAVMDYAREAQEWECRLGGVHVPNPLPLDTSNDPF